MLSNNSICNDCSNKKFCKHYDYAITNKDLTISIDKCDFNIESNIKITSPNTVTLPHKPTPWQPYTERPLGINFPDLNKVTSTYSPGITKPENSIDIKVAPVEEVKCKCELCGKLTSLSNCTDCGKRICSQCGYTNIDVNTGKQAITCDICFGGAKEDTSSSTEWDISNFESTSIKEEKDNVRTKSTKKVGSKGSNKKSAII